MARLFIMLFVMVLLAGPARAEMTMPVARAAESIKHAVERAQTFANTPESGIPLVRYYIGSAVQRREPPGWDVTWMKNSDGNNDPAGKSLAEHIVLHLNDDGTSRCEGCISMEPPPH